MDENQLNAVDIEIILEVLKHAKMKYEQTEYPNPEFGRKQLGRVEDVEKKLKALQAGMARVSSVQ